MKLFAAAIDHSVSPGWTTCGTAARAGAGARHRQRRGREAARDPPSIASHRSRLPFEAPDYVSCWASLVAAAPLPGWHALRRCAGFSPWASTRAPLGLGRPARAGRCCGRCSTAAPSCPGARARCRRPGSPPWRPRSPSPSAAASSSSARACRTVVLARLARQLGGRIVAVEHSPGWAGWVRRALERDGLDGVATVDRGAAGPASARRSSGAPWYAARRSTSCRPRDRAAAGRRARPATATGWRAAATRRCRCWATASRPGALVVLDDAERDGEREILDSWERDAGWSFDRRPAERIAIGRRAATELGAELELVLEPALAGCAGALVDRLRALVVVRGDPQHAGRAVARARARRTPRSARCPAPPRRASGWTNRSSRIATRAARRLDHFQPTAANPTGVAGVVARDEQHPLRVGRGDQRPGHLHPGPRRAARPRRSRSSRASAAAARRGRTRRRRGSQAAYANGSRCDGVPALRRQEHEHRRNDGSASNRSERALGHRRPTRRTRPLTLDRRPLVEDPEADGSARSGRQPHRLGGRADLLRGPRDLPGADRAGLDPRAGRRLRHRPADRQPHRAHPRPRERDHHRRRRGDHRQPRHRRRRLRARPRWARCGRRRDTSAPSRRASNVIYEIEEGRPFWKLRPLQLAITLLLIVLLAAMARWRWSSPGRWPRRSATSSAPATPPSPSGTSPSGRRSRPPWSRCSRSSTTRPRTSASRGSAGSRPAGCWRSCCGSSRRRLRLLRRELRLLQRHLRQHRRGHRLPRLAVDLEPGAAARAPSSTPSSSDRASSRPASPRSDDRARAPRAEPEE